VDKGIDGSHHRQIQGDITNMHTAIFNEDQARLLPQYATQKELQIVWLFISNQEEL